MNIVLQEVTTRLHRSSVGPAGAGDARCARAAWGIGRGVVSFRRFFLAGRKGMSVKDHIWTKTMAMFLVIFSGVYMHFMKYIYIYIHNCMYIYIYVYTDIDRYLSISIYIHIYIWTGLWWTWNKCTLHILKQKPGWRFPPSIDRVIPIWPMDEAEILQSHRKSLVPWRSMYLRILVKFQNMGMEYDVSSTWMCHTQSHTVIVSMCIYIYYICIYIYMYMCVFLYPK